MASQTANWDIAQSVRKSAAAAAAAAAGAALNGPLSSSPDRAKVVGGVAVLTFVLKFLSEAVKRGPSWLRPFKMLNGGK